MSRAGLTTRVRWGRGWLRYQVLRLLGRVGGRLPFVYQVDARWSLRTLRRRTDALLAVDAEDDRPLRLSEQRRYSQNGEDGVIAELVARVGDGNRMFVEIGASDGAENCTRALAEDGWSGVWVEADEDKAALARGLELPGVTVVRGEATRDGIVDMLAAAGVPPQPDLLVLDIDGDDLGVLRSVLTAHRPRIVVVEYNASFPPPLAWTLPLELAGEWDGTFRFGASLQALSDALGSDYHLEHCDTSGANAFFVRGERAARRSGVDVLARRFAPAAYSRHPFGHIRSGRALAPMAPMSVDDFISVRISDASVDRSIASPGQVIGVSFVLDNGSSHVLTSGRPSAVSVVLRWVQSADDEPAIDAPRTVLPHPVPPRSRRRLHLWVPAPSNPGEHTLRVALVSEGVAWREFLGGEGSFADLDIRVHRGDASTLPAHGSRGVLGP